MPVEAVPATAVHAPPGEATPTTVLACALGLTSLAFGVQADRGPLLLAGATAFAVLIVGFVWPVLALRGARVTLQSMPRDAVVGTNVAVEIAIRARGQYEVRILDGSTPWQSGDGSGAGTLVMLAARRGVVRRIHVELRTGAPLGVFIRRRVYAVPIDPPLLVGPVPAHALWRPRTTPEVTARDAPPDR
jgi:uncharacterized protein (DUF58 family)